MIPASDATVRYQEALNKRRLKASEWLDNKIEDIDREIKTAASKGLIKTSIRLPRAWRGDDARHILVCAENKFNPLGYNVDLKSETIGYSLVIFWPPSLD